MVKSVFEFKDMDLFPSMNKMLRIHWSKREEKKRALMWLIKEQKQPKHRIPVSVTFERFACKLQDWDNHSSSFKICGDALKDCEIIRDDNPSFIVTFLPKQVKVSKKEYEKIVVTIASIND